MTTAQQLVEGVLSLVSLPEAYLRIRDLINQPESSVDQISEVVGSDPGLAAQVLKMANSAFFGYGQKVDTVARAINIMGTSRLCDLALATATINTFSKIPYELVNMALFWRRSVYCGVISRLLAEQCNILDSERLFVTGLLADIGHLIIYLKLPEQAAEALEISSQEQLPIDRIEQQLMGFDYAEVGGELMHSWSLPESMESTARYQNKPEQAGEFTLEASITCIANSLASSIYREEFLDDETEEFITTLDSFALEITGLTAEQIAAATEESHQYVLETLQLLTPKRQVLRSTG